MCKEGHQLTHNHYKADAASRRSFLSSLISTFVFFPLAYRQEKTAVGMAEQFRQWSEEYEQEGLAGPFRGITTNYDVMPGLFQISPSGVSTEPVRNISWHRWITYNSQRRCSRLTISNGGNG
jgi:hypothetical protein